MEPKFLIVKNCFWILFNNNKNSDSEHSKDFKRTESCFGLRPGPDTIGRVEQDVEPKLPNMAGTDVIVAKRQPSYENNG